jgi:hypothetical protein
VTAATCRSCGETWARDPRLEVPCPSCRVGVGARCVRPSGHTTFGGQPHEAREEAAIVAGFLSRECTGRAAAGGE